MTEQIGEVEGLARGGGADVVDLVQAGDGPGEGFVGEIGFGRRGWAVAGGSHRQESKAG